ncbi:MAG: carboxypeptidase regulatory-like domain-containing protein [Steroidobacteraceae bacterium]
MNPRNTFLTLMTLVTCCGSVSHGATISGTVKGPEGAALEGVFVQAQNKKINATFMVLSDGRGRYLLQRLPAGDYRLSTKITGYLGDPLADVKLTADQSATFDLSLRKAPVRWNELSIYQAGKLWPASPVKDKLFSTCFTCHGFQTRMASVQHDAEGWLGRVRYMQAAMKFGLADRLNDQQVDEIAAYLTGLFSEHSVLPGSPQDAPGYKDTVRPIGSEAMNITFVEYDMPSFSRMPFSAAPDTNGDFWIPNFGVANKITRLDPKTGAMQDYPVPNMGTAAVHSAVPAPDGSVWLTEQGANKLGEWNPRTQKISEFQDAYTPGKLGYSAGSKHTLRFDPDGNVWASGNPLTRFERKTKKFTRFEEIAATYDVKEDSNGNIWFTRPDTSQIGMVDWKTLKVSLWTPPTPKCFPRRMQIDADGIVWFGEFNAGKLGRFDPKTQKFTEYQLPGPEPTPYGLGIDAENQIWYASYNMDVLGRFDPKTGKTVEYPFPHSENTIRELFRDAQGRMWYGSPSNDKVGYFTLTQ